MRHDNHVTINNFKCQICSLIKPDHKIYINQEHINKNDYTLYDLTDKGVIIYLHVLYFTALINYLCIISRK